MSPSEDRIRKIIVETVERNPGVTIANVQSEIRREFNVGSSDIIKALVREGVIRIRNGLNIYMVED